MKIFLELVDLNGKILFINIDSIQAVKVNDTNAYLTEVFCDFTPEPFIVRKAAAEILKKFPQSGFQFIK